MRSRFGIGVTRWLTDDGDWGGDRDDFLSLAVRPIAFTLFRATIRSGRDRWGNWIIFASGT
jgi:hypothetical protein